jgi:RNA polymerase sigma factor (sigma-70 family)
MELIREYADRGSEPAFADLARRHIPLVYSVALRHVGNPPDAQDVTQAVFIILAKKAAGLRQRTTLTGWLYETTRFTAACLLRTRARRQAREQEAYMQSTLKDPDTDGVWRQMAPILEDGMSRLNERERALLALRFFENKTAAETAALLGIREGAAQKRASRALEKLRRFFLKRGIASTTAAIGGAMSANSTSAPPPALADAMALVAVSQGAAAGVSTLTLVKGALKALAWAKAKTAILVGLGALLAVGTATVAVRAQHARAAADNLQSYAAGEKDFRLLQSVYLPYQDASFKPIADKSKFFAHWEGEFVKALSKTKGGGFLRLRVMEELGALQGALGKTQEEARTYTNMAALAVQAGDLRSQVSAASGLFEMAWLGQVDHFTDRVAEYESLSRQFFAQHNEKIGAADLCDTLGHIASCLMMHAKDPRDGSNPKDLLEHAERLWKETIALEGAGLTPLEVKLWWLGDCQSKLGRRQEAAASYQKILAMNQTNYPRLWIEYLRLCQINEKDSPPYREAIERALAEDAKSGAPDDYAGTLRHELGLSYLRTKQYAKSAEIFKANIGQNKDKAVDAYDMWLESDSYGNLGDMATRTRLLLDLVKQYPHSGGANGASNDLARIVEQYPNTPIAEMASEALKELRNPSGAASRRGDPAKN